MWRAVARCKVAEYGYVVGEEVDVTNGGFYNWYTTNTSATATQLTFITTNPYIWVTRKDNPAGLFTTSQSNWVLVLRAWR
ncbi:hypothetical protein RHDC4_01497 [Rhodocyclaceae bacterium]|nr:hypothetical protein RHDC4_01497 [Rhodocyclaceae bacterium]